MSARNLQRLSRKAISSAVRLLSSVSGGGGGGGGQGCGGGGCGVGGGAEASFLTCFDVDLSLIQSGKQVCLMVLNRLPSLFWAPASQMSF
jgi:hypothetical protein